MTDWEYPQCANPNCTFVARKGEFCVYHTEEDTTLLCDDITLKMQPCKGFAVKGYTKCLAHLEISNSELFYRVENPLELPLPPSPGMTKWVRRRAKRGGA